MKQRSLARLFASVVLSGLIVGCVSFDNFDQWQMDEYEADGKELERFEELSAEYEHIVAFNSDRDSVFIREASGSGTVEEGAYRFAHDVDSEFAHFHIELEALEAQNGGSLDRVAFLAKSRSRGSGFVEVYPGGDIRGSGGNPVSIESQGGLLNDAWTLVEFVADGNNTRVTGHNYDRVMDRRLESLSIFCFHGAAVEIDYILFD